MTILNDYSIDIHYSGSLQAPRTRKITELGQVGTVERGYVGSVCNVPPCFSCGDLKIICYHILIIYLRIRKCISFN